MKSSSIDGTLQLDKASNSCRMSALLCFDVMRGVRVIDPGSQIRL